MALKNKDGSVYRLSGPNPAMKTQTTWGSFTLHNMKWSSERFSNLSGQMPEVETQRSETKNVDVADDFVNELEQTKSSIRIVVPEKSKKSKPEDDEVCENATLVDRKVEVHEDSRDDEAASPEIDKVFIHCLPAKMSTKRDSLYGDVYKTVRYEDPFSFEGVIISESDLGLEVWTDADIKRDSVLYPKINSKRWWKVQYSEPKAMGRLLTCMPSDYQPSFKQD